MGQCVCSQDQVQFYSEVALKFPNGIKGITFYKTEWVSCDINTWLQDRYKNAPWTNWLVYNDQSKINNKRTKGHCKGIVAWTENRLSWLIHSVPNFPSVFTGSTISSIDTSELVYGQSFQYVECQVTEEKIQAILHQLHIMEANIIMEHGNSSRTFKKCEPRIYTVVLHENITHIAKPPSFHNDIYQDYLIESYPYHWFVETWIRGDRYDTLSVHMSEVTSLAFLSDGITFNESQDHSKWATTNNDYYWVGDLNRMTSQMNRGGGGFVCRNPIIARAFRSLIKSANSNIDLLNMI